MSVSVHCMRLAASYDTQTSLYLQAIVEKRCYSLRQSFL